MGPRAGLDAFENRRISFPYHESNHDFSVYVRGPVYPERFIAVLTWQVSKRCPQSPQAYPLKHTYPICCSKFVAYITVHVSLHTGRALTGPSVNNMQSPASHILSLHSYLTKLTTDN